MSREMIQNPFKALSRENIFQVGMYEPCPKLCLLMPLARVGARTDSTTSYSYNARRGQLPRTRIGIVRRTRARHAVCAEGLHFSAFHYRLHPSSLRLFSCIAFTKVRMRVFERLRHYIPRAQFHDTTQTRPSSL